MTPECDKKPESSIRAHTKTPVLHMKFQTPILPLSRPVHYQLPLPCTHIRCTLLCSVSIITDCRQSQANFELRRKERSAAFCAV
jgi:hypothetical protein